ncbi:MAG: hypothetical protein A3F84_25875 [Candidatus Handelsmanbacteria bacterium RIFCSPLOWO2_12_FULL_64_10]|uniref:Uncharacterized protein n=1 Tax=Handelsmanbacteria sp. (strain RIFCSPLOWO2_12_FULL_64_10) TaxID=1817868 RepID=A0A1F6CT67_HANXR|nr:MAG: hypothetical protein A3F84_25875 [Candidatus Handelsmanbacteria bacterium RIFCSPLOWO2_12_FULL_64_10]
MLKFVASQYAGLTILMPRAVALINDWPSDRALQEERLSALTLTVEGFGTFLRDLPVSDSLRFDLDRIQEDIAKFQGDGWTSQGTRLKTRLEDFQTHLLIELQSPLFLMVSKERREFYEQNEPPFGEEAAGRFAAASTDTMAAARCIALEEWTACVFHLMRVLEYGLRAFATELSIPMAATLELESWKKVLDQIDAEIRKLEALPRSAEKAELTHAYSEMASHFRYFKDAWRNHVMHARSTYDERQALEIYQNVRSFMGEIADRLAAAA